MIIDIEIIVVGAIMLVVILWFIWFKFTGWRNKWRYKPENDKGRKAEEKRNEGRREESFRREPTIEKPDSRNEVFNTTTRPTVLQTPKTVVTRKTNNGNGKVGKQFRNPFRRKI